MLGSRSRDDAPRTGSRAIDDLIASVLANADIQINGRRPWDMQIHHPDTLSRIAARRSLGLGESYMDGWWDCDALDEFIHRILRAGAEDLGKNKWTLALQLLGHNLRNRQSLRRSRQVAEQHYDLGNDLFEKMLDPTMAYSCGYWKDATTLHEAQEAKLDLICRKLELEPGMTLLDIGCGWGSLLDHAARHYGVRALGVTVSTEQAELARRRCADLPVEVLLKDYRTISGQYDRVVSVGMFEHVGRRNYRTFMETTRHLLKDRGLMLLHTIGNNESTNSHDAWIDKYIFPNGELPSIKQIARHAEYRYVVEDVHSFGPDYARTLKAWDANFLAHWPELKGRYDERFQRMWHYYLNLCAGAFRARTIQLWQWVFSKPGHRVHAYRSPR
ncbi:cyclopropane fatty acyl phospholipid synthase [Alloalcanivorax marinus]|uniref:cyclopropane fatty acyl phospholipid synthase n=1 Tax=Alloalcanivorax marinus TaxID=1177169 RepID=UPI000C35C854|nr:cyclopropane fatty acyl phospholipid synthase [Alloalcanivorax marinus]MBI54947.1 cyclopropane-fatty-acyl-phospholipid synthase [Alcanivorax sp.]MBL7250786.1 cyclopropane fatty acyl phospholipid synthase [Alloalcanivorax marinus]HCE40311.1 cyclopropane fatty acyl phospholipid synthase [Alcanivorax sp.]|tara:strand:+ start:124654 stop:125814 length:1161 start_codon:yes stop_codon:yes gene_type:complete